MIKDYKHEHKDIRKKLWIDVYVAYVGAANAIKPDGAKEWADIALQRFDERFKTPGNDTNYRSSEID